MTDTTQTARDEVETPKTAEVAPKTEVAAKTKRVTKKPATKAKVKSKATKGKAKAKAKASMKRAGGRRPKKFDGAAKITWLGGDNPARAGTERHTRFQRVIKHSGKTVEAFLKAGGIDGTLQRCVTAKLIKVVSS
jgi:hypothetical protein